LIVYFTVYDHQSIALHADDGLRSVWFRSGFASALATALVTGAGYLVPVFVKIFESEPGT